MEDFEDAQLPMDEIKDYFCHITFLQDIFDFSISSPRISSEKLEKNLRQKRSSRLKWIQISGFA